MKKTVFALCIVLSIFLCNTVSASAVVCPNPDAPYGVHHFLEHQRSLFLIPRAGGTHYYLYGYDHNGKKIYRNDCEITIYDAYCQYKCAYCSAIEDNSKHMHGAVASRHSVNHN